MGCCSLCQQGLIVEANRRVATLLGLERAALVQQPFRRFIHPDDQAVFAVGDQPLMTMGEWSACELRILKPDGAMFWARLEASAAEDETGALICRVVISDITERRQIDGVLERQSRFQQLLIEMSSTSINLPREAVSSAIQGSLRDMALFVDADRAYIFDYDFQRQICINTYEWCGAGIEPQLDCLQAVPLAMMPDWVEKHCQGKAMVVPDVFALPRGGIREVLEPQGIRSLLATPMMSNGRCTGFVGFDSVRQHHVYSEKEQSLLTVFALMLTSIQMRQQAEDRLRESEAQHRLLIENSHDIIYVLNDQGLFTFVSPAWTRLMGHPVSEVVGKSFHPFVHPDHLAECLIFLDTLFETGQRQGGIEYRVRHASGTWRWHTTGAVPLKDQDGAVTGFVGIAHDITERKQMEALRIERDSNRNLLDTVEAIIVALDHEGRIRLINRKGCQLLGYREAELIGKDWFEICLPPTVDQRQIHEIFQKALACDLVGSEYYENAVITRTGEQRLIAWHNSTIRDHHGQVIGGLSAGADITERKQAEEKLRLAASVFTHAREGIMITAADGEIIDVNEAFTRITGYPRDHVLGHNPRLLKSGWQDPAFYAAMWQDLIHKGHWDGEVWNRRSNGEVYAEMLTISAVRDASGQTGQYVALLSDITALKEHGAAA